MTPIRPTYRDVSRKLFLAYASRPFEFGTDGHALNQVEKGARELYLAGVALPEAIRLLRSLPGSAGSVHACDGELNACLKILWSYTGRAMDSGSWDWTAVDRFYSHDEKILGVVAESVRRHASPRDVTPPMLDLLDLRVENGALVDGAAWTLAAPAPANPTTADAGMVTVKAKLAPLTGQQKALLAACIAAHEGHTGVQQALANFEASATDLTQLHLFRIPDFNGFTDGWGPGDARVIEEAEDRFMREWAQGFTAGKGGVPDWRMVQMKGLDHQRAHGVRNLRGFGFKFGLSQFVKKPDGTFDLLAPGNWTVRTGAEWIAAGFRD